MRYIESRSGLTVAAEEGDARWVSSLLRGYDPSLRLVPRFDQEHGMIAWDVYEWHGNDRPSQYVCSWQTRDGMPLPLSSRLIDHVQMHDRNTAGAAPDPDAENRKLRERRQKDSRAEKEAITADHKPYIERGRVAVSLSGGQKAPSWLRTRRPARPT